MPDAAIQANESARHARRPAVRRRRGSRRHRPGRRDRPPRRRRCRRRRPPRRCHRSAGRPSSHPSETRRSAPRRRPRNSVADRLLTERPGCGTAIRRRPLDSRLRSRREYRGGRIHSGEPADRRHHDGLGRHQDRGNGSKSKTEVRVGGDGSITRNRSWHDDAAGADVNHTVLPDGTTVQDRRFKDGSNSVTTTRPDKSVEVARNTYDPLTASSWQTCRRHDHQA